MIVFLSLSSINFSDSHTLYRFNHQLSFLSPNVSLYFLLLQFLSMKLATVNPRVDCNIEGLLAKDVSGSR